MKIDHVLVTTDLSPDALRPLKPIAALARSLGARVTLLHVVQDLSVLPHGAPLAPAISPPDLARELERGRRELQKQRDALGRDLVLELDVVSGNDTAQAIVDYAKEHRADMIALSTHGRTGFRHLVLGSVAEAVLRRSTVPVVVFPRVEQ